jgi:K+-sensing histidine kinase KdpD
MKALRSRLLPYGVALVAVSVAVLFALLLRRSAGQLAYPLSFAAVMGSAWYGGLGPGLFAAGMAGIASSYFLFSPMYSFNITDPQDLVRLGLFALAAVLIGSLQAKLKAARQQLEAQATRLADVEHRGR